ncbi:hypothetical protein RO3G_05886 [Rhizopus delemar RA 99-880]|uniref:Uncharacterized protein n=1 Tax=Rhizopus delemar (strain RA 99-880 / ATCC MYA-4621 / FGSC 9543 / NRRL 43880) TaxID=246409 RepID=I1BYA1_RHIO9|nr:hypothetical protein RO3G_05886 [Rhizopus delemar RA 99-880]|eukprot:EIE81181.1 hypothetical protein RO3G_05886 [Rhizopus delemar RA 99-880]
MLRSLEVISLCLSKSSDRSFFAQKQCPFLLMTAIENQISGCCPLLFYMVKQTLDA